MNAQRLSHADLEPTFRGAGRVISDSCSSSHVPSSDFSQTSSLEFSDDESRTLDLPMMGLMFGAGILVGLGLSMIRRPVMEGSSGLLQSGRTWFGDLFSKTWADGPSTPFDPRTKDLNVGVGALSPQSYRSSEEVSQMSEVMEASEESFPASDPPSFTGMSSVGRCASSQ